MARKFWIFHLFRTNRSCLQTCPWRTLSRSSSHGLVWHMPSVAPALAIPWLFLAD